MGKSLQNVRAIAALSVVIAGTLGGASFAAVTHTDSHGTTTAATSGSLSDTTDTPAPTETADPAATLAPDPQGYSLYAQFERPVVDFFETQAKILVAIPNCKTAVSPRNCVNRNWAGTADALDSLASDMESVKLPDSLDSYKVRVLNATRSNAAIWHTMNLDLTKAQLDKNLAIVNSTSDEMDSAIDDLDYYLVKTVPSAKTGKELTTTLKQAELDLGKAAKAALTATGLNPDGTKIGSGAATGDAPVAST